MEELYKEYGYYSNYLNSYEFEGSSGFTKMNNIMDLFRNGFSDVAGYKIKEIKDYDKGIEGLPKSNVIKMIMESGDSIVIRPSGTEPKLKVYMSICGDSIEKNNQKYQVLIKKFEEYLK